MLLNVFFFESRCVWVDCQFVCWVLCFLSDL